MNITKEKFFESYHVSEQQLLNAKISWEELCEIANDYEMKIEQIYEPVRKEFIEKYFLDKEKENGLQSYKSRCKNPEHVIEKIIRKRNENYVKYKSLNKENYWMFLTDLIGVRGLLLYRQDWVRFHTYITEKIQDSKYVEDSIKDYINDGSVFMAEPPKVHIRSGDFYEIYVGWVPLENILDRKHYRSAHYIVNYKGVYIEIQIRTLLEEGWGEIDHDILYPHKRDNIMLTEFSELLNRLVGMGDEMSSYYKRLEKVPEKAFVGKRQNIVKPKQNELRYVQSKINVDTRRGLTFKEGIDYIIRE